MEICVPVVIYEQMCMLVRMTSGYLEEAFRKESRNEVELGTEEMRYFVVSRTLLLFTSRCPEEVRQGQWKKGRN